MLGCGMLSSTIAMTATYPLNLIRTRLQMTGEDEIMVTRVARGEHHAANPFAGSTGALGILQSESLSANQRVRL